MRKRKVTYPTPKTANRPDRGQGATGDPRGPRLTVASIDKTALEGRDDLAVGDRVRIGGGGLYSGEIGRVGALNPGVIPAATVQTEGGRTRRVRVIDLEHVSSAESASPD
jgi:hypothetical protein